MIELWTDGSCNNNPKDKNGGGIGGWSFIIVINGEYIDFRTGNDIDTNSSKMELEAVRRAMMFSKKHFKGEKVTICSDSAYVVNCFKDKWYKGWKQRHWLNVKNEKTWKKILKIYFSKCCKFKFRKVKGHSGLKYNELADYIAGQSRRILINEIDK